MKLFLSNPLRNFNSKSVSNFTTRGIGKNEWGKLVIIGLFILTMACSKPNEPKISELGMILSKPIEYEKIDPNAIDVRPNQEYDLIKSNKSYFEDKDGKYSVKNGKFQWRKKNLMVFSSFLDNSKQFAVIANSKSVFVTNAGQNLYVIDKRKKSLRIVKILFDDIQFAALPGYLGVYFDKLHIYRNAALRDIGLFFEEQEKRFTVGSTIFPLKSFKGHMIFPSEPAFNKGDTTYEIYQILDYKFNWRELKFDFPEKVNCGKIELESNPLIKAERNTIEFSRGSPCGQIIFRFDWFVNPPKLLDYRNAVKR